MTTEQHGSKTAKLEREIAEAEQFIQDIELDGFSPAIGTATKLAQLRSELSRLRNEGGDSKAEEERGR